MIIKLFYFIKPLVPRRLQLALRRFLIKINKRKYYDIWPIDPHSSNPPKNWNGWPENKKFAFILTHDVELQRGHDRCRNLAEIETELGFVSSFNFVPERYKVSSSLRANLENMGFEVGVHGLKHDGKLYASRDIFIERARKINRYLSEWNTVGFRSPAMHHNLDWIHDLKIEYDSSTLDTDPFEPQNDGVGTIFPFWLQNKTTDKGYVELPYTLPQDSTLFIIMNEKSISIWKKKMDWIAEKGGMALVNVHPDYLDFSDTHGKHSESFPIEYYTDLLNYVKNEYKDQYWNVLPKDLAIFWKSRYGSKTEIH